MILPSFARSAATLIHRGQPNRHGDVGTETRTGIDLCHLQPIASTESTDDGQRTDSRYLFIGPRELIAAEAADAVEIDGVRYEIDGEPQIWPEHVEMTLRRIRG